MKICGIYGIFNTTNRKVLVGSTMNCDKRWKQHRSNAERNAHPNPHFQRAWNIDKESSFEFRILEECSVESLIPREDYWMAFYKSLDDAYGYNMRNASQTFISEETRKKLSKSMKGRIPHNKGKHLTEAQRIKLNAWRKDPEKKRLWIEKLKTRWATNFARKENNRKRIKIFNDDPIRKKLQSDLMRELRCNLATKHLFGQPLSEESQRRKGESLKEFYRNNNDASQTISKRMKLLWVNNPAWKVAIIERNKSNIGKPLSVEHRRRLSQSRVGLIQSDETKRKIGSAQLGVKNHRYGKHLSDAHKQAIKDYWQHRREAKMLNPPTLQLAVNQ
jgi:group I intron endonuclease